MSQSTKRTAYYGLITALGLILSYVETLIPINFGVPGAKPGLANLAVLLCLRAPYDNFRKNITGAFFVGVLRIVLSGFLFGNLFAIAYSLAGFIAALGTEAVMEYQNLRHRERRIATSPALGRVAALLDPKAQTDDAQGTASPEEFGITSISAVGGVMHNMGQLLVAVSLCGTPVVSYLPWLIIFGVIAGLVTGIAGAILIKRVKRFARLS